MEKRFTEEKITPSEEFIQVIDKQQKARGGYFAVDNSTVDKWLRVMGVYGFSIWSTMRRFCEGTGEAVFPKANQNDWAEFVGIKKDTFTQTISAMEAAGILEIRRPVGREKLFGTPSMYILNDLSKLDPLESLTKLKQFYETSKKKRLRNIQLSETNRFVDKVFDNESIGLFRRIKPVDMIYPDRPEFGSIDRPDIGATLENSKLENSKEKILRNIFKGVSDETLMKKNKDQHTTSNLAETGSSLSLGYAESLISSPNRFKRKAPRPIGFDLSRTNKLAQRQLAEAQQLRRNIKSPKEHITNGWKRLVLDLWNDIEGTSVHKSVTTALIANTSLLLDQLSNGKFFSNHIDPDFLKKCKIPEEWISGHRKFTHAEIARTIKKYSLYLKGGYWPMDKRNLPRSLNTFLYNPKKGTSLFLMVAARPCPEPLSEQNKSQDHNPEYTKPFQTYGILNGVNPEFLPNIYRGIAAIERRVLNEYLFDFKDSEIISRFGQKQPGALHRLFKEYAYFVYDVYNDWEPSEVFNPYGKHFKDFITQINEDVR